MKLIDKDALVAWAKETYLCKNVSMIRKVCYKQLLEHLDTLEVKEVDLDEEFNKYCDNLYLIDLENEPYTELFECAKHFFELGLKVQKDEPISEDLEEVAKYYIPSESYHMIIESEGEGSGENMYDYKQLIDMFKNGVQWQKNHF